MRRLPAAVLVVLAVVATASAQNFGSPLTFRFEWRLTSVGGHPAIAGYVHNDNVWKVTKVRVAVDVLDASGNTLARATAWVPGDINEGGHGYFVVPLPAEGASYRPFVESFEYLEKAKG